MVERVNTGGTHSFVYDSPQNMELSKEEELFIEKYRNWRENQKNEVFYNIQSNKIKDWVAIGLSLIIFVLFLILYFSR